MEIPTINSILEELLSIVGIQATNNIEKYIGVPTIINISPIKDFKFDSNMIWNRINIWKTKFLSQIGKKCSKDVVQVIPTYYCMGIFL